MQKLHGGMDGRKMESLKLKNVLFKSHMTKNYTNKYSTRQKQLKKQCDKWKNKQNAHILVLENKLICWGSNQRRKHSGLLSARVCDWPMKIGQEGPNQSENISMAAALFPIQKKGILDLCP